MKKIVMGLIMTGILVMGYNSLAFAGGGKLVGVIKYLSSIANYQKYPTDSHMWIYNPDITFNMDVTVTFANGGSPSCSDGICTGATFPSLIYKTITLTLPPQGYLDINPENVSELPISTNYDPPIGWTVDWSNPNNSSSNCIVTIFQAQHDGSDTNGTTLNIIYQSPNFIQ